MKIALFLLVAVVAPLYGCSAGGLLTSNAPPPIIYALRTDMTSPSESDKALARVVEIPKPSVPPGFESDRIALLLNGGHQLDYYAAAQWPAAFDEVVQDFTRRTIGNRMPYIVAVTPEQSLNPAYRLAVKVNEFQPVYDGGSQGGAPKLAADLQFTLIALPEERIVTSFMLSRRGDANGNDLDSVTLGLEAMLQQIENEALERIEPYLKAH